MPDQRPAVESTPTAADAVFGDQVEVAERYVRLLAGPGTERGLLGPREAGRLWNRHVLNSAVVTDLFPGEPVTVVDVGSGAGLPGIPMAIRRPDCRLVLVEPLERRAAFLAEVVLELGLTNCTVLRSRAEQAAVANSPAADADLVTSRAVAPLGRLALWCAPLLRPGGLMLALKGTSAADEIARDAADLRTAGLVDIGVVSAGDGLLDLPTLVVRASRDETRRPRRGRGGDQHLGPRAMVQGRSGQ